eukprot:gene15070-16625_t
MADTPGNIQVSPVKKKKYHRIKMHNLLTGRNRRRINSENNRGACAENKNFLRSSSVSSPPLASAGLFKSVNQLDTAGNCRTPRLLQISIPDYGNGGDDDDDSEELDFFEMLGRVQSSRLDDQRTSLPASLSQSSEIEDSLETISLKTEPKKEPNMEPIIEVLSLGPPYPMVVLPVEGDYWMEGTNHILQKDMHNRPVIPRVDLSKCVVELDETAHAYRESFLGREHLNFAVIDSKYGPMLLSVKCESNVFGDGNYNDSRDYYEIILRLKDKTIHQFLPSGSLSEFPGPREFIQGVIQDELDIDRFHPIAIPRISGDVVRYDEHVLQSCYKVGVFYQKHGQTTEEEYFGNVTHSRAMAEFLDCIGDRVRLEGFKGYRGGLDVKYNQTGEYSYHTKFRNREFMFHISTLLPHKSGDVQQVQRKRHIGNDIVAIVFQDENTPFCPTSVRSHFLHVFIIVQVIDANTTNARYKVSVTARDGVPSFGPTLPNPAVFKKGAEFREFLMTKILNAELAACKSEKFSQLAERTRAMLLQQMVDDFILKNEQMLEDSSQLNRTFSGGKGGNIFSSFRSAVLNSKTRDGSSNSLNSTLMAQCSQINLSKSLNDITDAVGSEDTKKEKKKLFSRNKGNRPHSRESDKRDSKSVQLAPTSPSNTWPNSSQTSLLPDRGSFNRSKSTENGYKNTAGHLTQRLHSQQLQDQQRKHSTASESAQSSPSLSHNRLMLQLHPDMCTNRQNSNLSSDNYGDCLRSNSFDEHERSRLGSQPLDCHFISVSSCSSSYEDVSSTSACSALDAAQREIDVLRSEISKLKTDKMDLVRQNVVYQREIRKFKEKSLHQTAQLYSVNHELSRLRMSGSQDNQSTSQESEDNGHEYTFIDFSTPVNETRPPVNQSLECNNNANTPVNHDTTPVNHDTKAANQDSIPIADLDESQSPQNEMTPVKYEPKFNNYRAGRGITSRFSDKRHSISHV